MDLCPSQLQAVRVIRGYDRISGAVATMAREFCLTTLVIAVVAAIAAVGSTVFAGLSLTMLARQTKSLSDQVRLQIEQANVLAEQTQLQAGQYEILASATELQFNLNVMIRLQEVLFSIADDEDSRKKVWGILPGQERPQMAEDALLDVVAMALKACDRLPHFASNLDDWKSYTEYVMENSPSLRARALANPKWWPEITPYAGRAQRISSRSNPSGSRVADHQVKTAKMLIEHERATGQEAPDAARRVAEAAPEASADLNSAPTID